MTTRIEDRVNGLDTLRFLAACWVIMGHWGPIPITAGYSNESLITKYANGFYTGFFSAPAAVIVFFVEVVRVAAIAVAFVVVIVVVVVAIVVHSPEE